MGPIGQASHMREGEKVPFPSLRLTEVPHLSLHIQPQFFGKEQDTLESDDKQHWRRPQRHEEVSSSMSLSLPPTPTACPTSSVNRAFSHHLLFLLSTLGSPRLILIKDLGSLLPPRAYFMPRTPQALPHLITTARGERELSSLFPDKNTRLLPFPPFLITLLLTWITV